MIGGTDLKVGGRAVEGGGRGKGGGGGREAREPAIHLVIMSIVIMSSCNLATVSSDHHARKTCECLRKKMWGWMEVPQWLDLVC